VSAIDLDGVRAWLGRSRSPFATAALEHLDDLEEEVLDLEERLACAEAEAENRRHELAARAAEVHRLERELRAIAVDRYLARDLEGCDRLEEVAGLLDQARAELAGECAP